MDLQRRCGRGASERREGVNIPRREGSDPAKRAAILVAAQRLLGGGDYHAMTIPSVARIAGVAEGTIYNYFADKVDLAKRALAAAEAEVERDLLTALPQNADPADRLLFAAMLLLQAAEEEPERARLLFVADHTPYAGADVLVGAVTLLISTAASGGYVRPVDPELLARMWLGAVGAAIRARLKGAVGAPLTEIADEVARVALDGVRAPGVG